MKDEKDGRRDDETTKRGNAVKSKEERAEEQVEAAKKTLARAMCRLEVATKRLSYTCKEMGWDDDVCYTIREGMEKLGAALAGLTIWDEEIPDEDK